jgi:hypothetical protein
MGISDDTDEVYNLAILQRVENGLPQHPVILHLDIYPRKM